MKNDSLYSLINLGYRVKKKNKTREFFKPGFRQNSFVLSCEYSEIVFTWWKNWVEEINFLLFSPAFTYYNVSSPEHLEYFWFYTIILSWWIVWKIDLEHGGFTALRFVTVYDFSILFYVNCTLFKLRLMELLLKSFMEIK